MRRLRKSLRSAAGNFAVDLPCARVVGRRESLISLPVRALSAIAAERFISSAIDMANSTALAVSIASTSGETGFSAATTRRVMRGGTRLISDFAFFAVTGFFAAGFLAFAATFLAGFLATGFLAFATGFFAAGFLAGFFATCFLAFEDFLTTTPMTCLLSLYSSV